MFWGEREGNQSEPVEVVAINIRKLLMNIKNIQNSI